MVRGSVAQCAVMLITMLPVLAAAGTLRNGHSGTMAVADGQQDSMKMMGDVEVEIKKPEKTDDKPQSLAMKDEQITWPFWKPLVCAMAFLIIMTDLIGRACDCALNHGLMKEASLFLFTMIGFATVVFLTLDWNGAGMQILVGAAIMGVAIAILFFAFSLSIVAFSKDARDPVKLILSDMSLGLRGLVRIIMLCTLCDVISQVAGVDWARLVVALAFLLLALALALKGVIGDLLAHIFIRLDQHFFEGDFILFGGNLVQIQACNWRHTVGLSVKKKAIIYIPNGSLIGSALVNRTTDVVEKVVEMDAEMKKLNLEG